MEKQSLAFSHGCLWLTNASNTLGEIRLYCIDVSDWTVTEVEVPGAHPLPVGNYYVESSLIDFPDGRIGKVSRYEPTDGGYLSVLRTYTVSGSGSAATIAWSTDYEMFDPDNFAVDEHGISTDGTFLYRIQWRSYDPNTKVWGLSTGDAAQPVYAGNYTMPYDNMHFLSHDHIGNRYLVGHWDNANFFITTASDPGPGPGNPLLPTFGEVIPIEGGYVVQITNYDAAFTWSGTATEGGTATIDDTGLLTVTGLSSETTSTATVTASRAGFPDGSSDVQGTSLVATTTTSTTSTTTTTTTTSTTTPSSTSTTTVPTTASAPTTSLLAPVPMPGGALPLPAAGQVVVMVNGVPQLATLSPQSAPPGVRVTGDGFAMTIVGVGPDGVPLPLSANGNVRVEPGRYARIQGSGFEPGSDVDVWLFSDPRYLGRIVVDAAGAFDGQVLIPTDVADGVHTLQANGTTADGAQRSVSIQVEVDRAGSPAPTTLAFTGATGSGLLALAAVLVLAGLALLCWAQRRPAQLRR
jgi:hypothetical protein